jgi:hypothetical protein
VAQPLEVAVGQFSLRRLEDQRVDLDAERFHGAARLVVEVGGADFFEHASRLCENGSHLDHGGHG